MFEKNCRILVVDDMQTMRKIIETSLRESGFTEIIKADDGVKAWEILKRPESKIELVISDLNMPNMGGIDLLKKVRSHKETKLLPFIVVTGDSEIEQVKEAIAAGVTEFIVKPFNQITLEMKLKSTFQKVTK